MPVMLKHDCSGTSQEPLSAPEAAEPAAAAPPPSCRRSSSFTGLSGETKKADLPMGYMCRHPVRAFTIRCHPDMFAQEAAAHAGCVQD